MSRKPELAYKHYNRAMLAYHRVKQDVLTEEMKKTKSQIQGRINLLRAAKITPAK